MKKLIKKNNKSVSKFQLGGLFFTESAHPERTWVNAVEARKRGIPLTADPRDPNVQWMYSYDILDPTPGTRPNSIDKHPVTNPESIYFLYDPDTGKILNQGMGIVDNALDLIPVDNSWAYHPQLGWFQPNIEGGEITNPDIEMTRNFLGNTLGWEQAYRLPPDAIDSMGKATTDAMIQEATGIVGGEILGAAAKYAPRVMQFATKAPRTTVAAGQLGLGTASGYALNKDEIGEYLSNIDDEITDQDFENMGGKNALPDMLKWLAEHGYNYTVSNDPNSPAEIKRSYYVHPNEKYVVGPQGFFYYEDIPFGTAALFKGLRNKKWFPWALGTGYVLGKGARIAYYNSPAAKAGKLVNYLLSKGYVTIKGNLSSYNIGTDLNNNPQITDTARVIPQMQDSAATPTPYNEYQGEVYDLTGELINPDYVGFETDTASNE